MIIQQHPFFFYLLLIGFDYNFIVPYDFAVLLGLVFGMLF